MNTWPQVFLFAFVKGEAFQEIVWFRSEVSRSRSGSAPHRSAIFRQGEDFQEIALKGERSRR